MDPRLELRVEEAPDDVALDRTPDDDLSPVRVQRRLAERGTTFREGVDAVRFEAARAWLTDPSLGLAEVGWMLGFSDQRAFTRAFVRWAGCTPGVWRGGVAGPPDAHPRPLEMRCNVGPSRRGPPRVDPTTRRRLPVARPLPRSRRPPARQHAAPDTTAIPSRGCPHSCPL